MSKNNSKMSGWLITGAIILVIILLYVWSVSLSHSTPKNTDNPDALAGINIGDAPWPAELDHLRERLSSIGLPALPEEGTVLHIHQHLDIFVDGNSVAIPAGIGINESAGFISPIHVHDNTGIIHVESPTVQTFTLGQFFDIWGVRLTAQCLGGYCVQADKTLKVFVNGAPYTGDPRGLALASHQEIVLAYGTTAELPSSIPSAYAFPAGY